MRTDRQLPVRVPVATAPDRRVPSRDEAHAAEGGDARAGSRTRSPFYLLLALASAVALSAATYRILARVLGFEAWVAVAGTLACVVFPLAAMVHDHRRRGTIHPVYLWGVPAIVLVIAGAFLIGMTPGGDVMEGGLAWIGRALRPLY